MRKTLGVLMLVWLVVGAGGGARADAKPLGFQHAPLLWGGTVLVAVRELLAATTPDATLAWDATTETAVVKYGQSSLSMQMGTVAAQRETGPVTLPAAPVSHADTLYAPLRSLAAVLGLAVSYEAGAAPRMTLTRGADTWAFPAPPEGQVLLVYAGTTLSPGFDMGVATGGGRADWVTDHEGYMEAAYPAGQQWGAIFLTKGPPSGDEDFRQTLDASSFNYLVLDLKGAAGGEKVALGVKTASDPDNGLEPKHPVGDLTTNWQTVSVPLAELVRAPKYPADRFGKLYVVCELVFGRDAETIFFRNVRFEK
jgi:hypothetical protein